MTVSDSTHNRQPNNAPSIGRPDPAQPANSAPFAVAGQNRNSQSRSGRDSVLNASIWFLTGQVVEGEGVRHIPIHTSPFRIGRRSDMALSIPYATVSGLHAELIETESGLVLRDLRSTNGTYVNGERVKGERQIQPDDLIQFADVPFRVRRHSADVGGQTVHEDLCDHALALVQFDKLMASRAVIPYYQPIICLKDETSIGFEVLARSEVFGLETPAAMFRAAAQLDLELDLSRMARWEGVRVSMTFETLPHLFVNTHPKEAEDSGLLESIRSIRELSPRQSLTLEIHEAAITNAHAMAELQARLKDLNVGLAFDDFGAGQNRLLELLEIRPDYLKFDMGLIRDIHLAGEQRQSMVQALVKMVEDLGIVSLAEGIEKAEEADFCRQAGFQLAQGYFFGRPSPAKPRSRSDFPVS